MIPESIRQTAAEMADELQAERLEVALQPAPIGAERGRMIRCSLNWNPEWYRRLCAAYPSRCRSHATRRKIDTVIKRQHTLRELRRIASGRTPTAVYGQRLLPIIEDEVAAASMSIPDLDAFEGIA